VLADGLLCNEIITAIRLDSNPLGDDTRLILRALQRKTNPVQYIRYVGSFWRDIVSSFPL
jgi:hypothetical protein